MALKTDYTGNIPFQGGVSSPSNPQFGYIINPLFTSLKSQGIGQKCIIKNPSSNKITFAGEAFTYANGDIDSANNLYNISNVSASTGLVKFIYLLPIANTKLYFQNITNGFIARTTDEGTAFFNTALTQHQMYKLEDLAGEIVILLAGASLTKDVEVAYNADGISLKAAVTGDCVIGTVSKQSLTAYTPVEIKLTKPYIK